MHYYNGISAATRIGISYKTLLRYIDKGRIVPEEGKTPAGQLVISEDQVESLRLEIKKERDMFRRPQTDSASSRHHETPMDTLGVPYTDTTLNEALKHIGKLQARVDVQDARIAELECRVSTLEQSGPGEATNTIGQTKTETDTNPITPHPQPPTAFSELSGSINDEYHGDNEPTLRPSTSPVPPPDIPPGSLLMADFAQLHNVPRATFSRHCTQGVRGERVETIERPKPGREKYNEKERWLGPEQQEEALRFWGRQNVRYSLCARAECGCIGNVR